MFDRSGQIFLGGLARYAEFVADLLDRITRYSVQNQSRRDAHGQVREDAVLAYMRLLRPTRKEDRRARLPHHQRPRRRPGHDGRAWLGDRPPPLRDYHDDLVAEPVLLPVPSRTIVIQAVGLLMVN